MENHGGPVVKPLPHFPSLPKASKQLPIDSPPWDHPRFQFLQLLDHFQMTSGPFSTSEPHPWTLIVLITPLPFSDWYFPHLLLLLQLEISGLLFLPFSICFFPCPPLLFPCLYSLLPFTFTCFSPSLCRVYPSNHVFPFSPLSISPR